MEAVGGGGEIFDGEGLAKFERPRFEDRRPMFIYIMNPTGPTHRVVDATTNAKIWQWNLPGAKKIVVNFEPSLNDLYIKISAHIPEGRKVRELIGALENPSAAEASKPPTDISHIRSNEDLDAFLCLTEAKPIKILAILY